ncbi:SAM and PH domain-containing protein [Akanthomyces lecanii RCEF 1005]|uniref:SAM and PH domain-containing protein n=1 Tax=Akanthomyces lecanii RCEF 1005 TaxID=1081108 RepID=A0A162K7V9_CORDF|nr:SAM and PH domain-containing protein [Akanthomyces lecanii RCEF 1005]
MEYEHFQSGARRTYSEMRQKPAPQDTFFNLINDSQHYRPTSVATEFVDTDWDEEDTVLTDAEDISPRGSFQSTTLDSFDEALTPRSSRGEHSPKQIEGPSGPHLFHLSSSEYGYHHVPDENLILGMSPITPKPRGYAEITVHPPLPQLGPFQYTRDELDTSDLVSWTPEMVAQSMLNAGIEVPMADRFIENDINGPILITLKFEDLRELDIPSFGIRTKIWHQIQTLRDSQLRAKVSRPSTPIEDHPSREVRKEARKQDQPSLKRRGSSRRQRRSPPAGSDNIMPYESVSIIGIEQVIPQPHECSRGEDCTKFKKQQRLIENFRRMNPHIDMNATGKVVIYGDAGNPETARAIDPNEDLRPFSDATPSLVASSDILGTGGMPPLQYLQEASLRSVQSRDPQENVRQFLNFQRTKDACLSEVPPTPPFELAPAAQPPHHGLRRLPKLSIPLNVQAQRLSTAPRRASTLQQSVVPQQSQQEQHQQQHQQQLQQPQQHQVAQQQRQSHHHQRSSSQDFVPYRMGKADPRSPDLETPRNPYRFGTPFSDFDVPVTAVPLGPVSRDASQSVPPDMSYRAAPGYNVVPPPQPPRSQSRASYRRPSFPILPAVSEHKAVLRVSSSRTPSPQEPSPPTTPPQAAASRPVRQAQPQAPPRGIYPWSSPERHHRDVAQNAASATSLLLDGTRSASATPAPAAAGATGPSTALGVSFQGPMKKRKTRLLRHEWQDGYFTLKGTRLNMHKDMAARDRTLEYIDIDDYAIACSSLASTSKLSAAFKAVSISHNREKSDSVAAFSFQLIPQDKNTARLRKRESSMSGASSASADGVNGTGKTHHFAVKNRDDRIDWMREMMLAKALKQKGDGFEISVNGNMI